MTTSPAPAPTRHITWSDDLSVHSPTLDLHHRILMGGLNRMQSLRETWQAALPAVGKELWALISYCRIHFFVEELAMERLGVGAEDLEGHRKIHRNIVKRMTALWEQYETTPTALPYDNTLRFLQAWLIKHVKEEDRTCYAPMMRGNRAVEQEIRKIRYADVAKKLHLKHRGETALTLAQARVMVIEDSLDRRTHMVRALKDQGCNAVQAKSVGEAHAVMAANDPHVVVLGWHLPEAGTLAKRLYMYSTAQVIASHSGPADEVLDACEVLGVADILSHPASSRDMIEIVKAALEGFIPLRALIAQRAETALGA